MLQAVHARRWEARPSTPAAGNAVRGRRGVVNSGPMAVACPLSNSLPLRVSGGYWHQALRFKSRVEVAGRQSRGRTRTLCVVMAGQRGGEEASVAGRAAGSGSSATSEGLREELLVSSLVDEAPQVEHFFFSASFALKRPIVDYRLFDGMCVSYEICEKNGFVWW
jgi:hypothetical protein